MKKIILGLVLCFVLVSGALADPNMVVSYEFDELGAVAGGTTADTGIVPASDGTLAGSATIVADAGGDVGPKTASNVLDQGYVDCGTVPKLANLGSFTVSAWMKILGGGWGCIADGSGNSLPWHIHVPGGIRFLSPSNFEVYSAATVGDDKWHHVVCVRDVAAAKVRIYIDGKLDAEAASTTGLIDNQNLLIGKDSVAGNIFGGKIDSVKIFDDALTADEIASLYAEGLPVPLAVPGAASNPDPSDTLEAVSVSADGLWDAGSDALWYNVYLTTTEADITGSDPCSAVSGLTFDTTFDFGILAENTVYYWRVDSSNALGTTDGPVWEFTTGYEPGSSTDPDLLYYANFDDVGLSAGGIIYDYGAYPWQDAPLEDSSETVYDATRDSGVMDVANLGGLDLGPADDLGMGSSYTVSMWFNSIDGASYDYMFGLLTPGRTSARMFIYMNGTQIYAEHPYIANTSATGTWTGTGWHHVALVFDDTANTLTLYVDNVAGTPAACDRLDPVAGYNAYVGQSSDGYDFGGMMDDVAIYSVPLSAPEISDIYNNGVAAGYASGHAPADEEVVVASATTSLDWVNAGGAEGVDVLWYGNSKTNTPTNLTSGALVETVAIPEILSYPNTYYWRVDTIVGGVSQAGRMVSFEVGNFAPVATASVVDAEVYMTAGTVDVALLGDVTDDGQPGPYTVTWTEMSGPGGSSISDADVNDDAVATITVAGNYVFEILADDGEKTDIDTVAVKVYANSCAHAAAQDGFAWKDGDTNNDCEVNLEDLKNLAVGWLSCYHSDCP